MIKSHPDYLVLGHVTKDLLDTPPGYSPGGTALYSALAAQRLGLQVAVVTAYAPEDAGLLDRVRDAGVWVHRVESAATTTFRNIYDAEGRRSQVLSAQASPVSYGDVPPAWLDAPIAHLGPVAQELPAGVAPAFANRLLGVTPQGWMRSWDERGRVRHSAWPVPPALAGLPANAFLVLSFEDLGYDPTLIARYASLAPLVAVTQGPREAHLYERGDCIEVPACTAGIVDPTGAGDVFAAALFVRYLETGDLAASARFAHAAAACNIEGFGPSAIPDRATVEERLRLQPGTEGKLP